MVIETRFETAAECRDVEAAQCSGRMRGVDDDGAVQSRVATLGDFLIDVIASCSCRVERSNPPPIQRALRRALVLEKVQPVDERGSLGVCGQFNGVLLRNVER